MNIHMDNSRSVDFFSLLNSFNLKHVHSPPPHKAGKDLDLILLSITCGGFDYISVHELVASNLPIPCSFLSLEVYGTMVTLCSSLSSCLDIVCPVHKTCTLETLSPVAH